MRNSHSVPRTKVKKPSMSKNASPSRPKVTNRLQKKKLPAMAAASLSYNTAASLKPKAFAPNETYAMINDIDRRLANKNGIFDEDEHNMKR